jgi:hypothetical protein
MSNNMMTLNNPGLKTLDVTTATGIGYKYVAPCAGNLHIGNSEAIVNTAIVNTSTPAVLALQLVRGGTTYTLGTISFVDGAVVGTTYKFTPSNSVTLPGDNFATDLTRNPFVRFLTGDTIQTNITTAGLGGTPAGAYEANIVIESASNIS